MGFAQILPDKPSMTMKCTAIVTYRFNFTLLNVSSRKSQLLIGNRYRLIGVKPVCCRVEQLEEQGSREVEKDPCAFFYLR